MAHDLEVLEHPAYKLRCGAPVGHPDETISGRFSKYGIVPCSYLEARLVDIGRFEYCINAAERMTEFNFLGDGSCTLQAGTSTKARCSAPFLALHLGKDRACYDFLKWYIIVAPSYDISDTSLPFLNIQNANALESVDDIFPFTTVRNAYCLLETGFDLSVLVALYLLKLRLIMDATRVMSKARVNNTNYDSDDARFLLHKFSSSIVANNPLIQNSGALESAKSDCDLLFSLVHQRNKHFSRLLLGLVDQRESERQL
ncbi:hypothetical protein HK097_008065 [Rhizophlyctis rosea]|uniref:Uncharacterized protein n=1 Tax=Rhizophlyctis rosea TaxID=64517 RepID=A0AAD5X1W9_9FUNG|nr:hypothetical protein HK097_008065 [Rhizophlyctis rosea]